MAIKIDKKKFAERLKILMSESNETVYSLADLTNLTAPTISRYANAEMAPKIPTIEKISRLFKVNPSWLMGLDVPRELPKSLSIGSSFSDKEVTHIQKYRRLDQHGQKAVDLILDIELERVESMNVISLPFIDNEPKVIYLPLPLQEASAGSGEFADDDTCENIAVYYNEHTKKADYLMRVHGDSMEPDMFDGDILLVRNQPAVEIGEIGVFINDGERYVKEFGGDCLVSHNERYADIALSLDSYCIGKVIEVLRPEWIAK